MKKIFIYIKCALFCGIRNKTRCFLTMMGLMTSSVFICCGMIFLDAFYNGQMEGLDNIPDDAIMIYTDDTMDYEAFSKMIEGKKPQIINYATDAVCIGVYEENDVPKYIKTYVVGAQKASDINITFGNDEVHIARLSLLKGRLIEYQDVIDNVKVIVIDELLERIFFGKEDAIGKKVTIGDGRYEVVGVVESSAYSKRELRELKNNKSITEYAEYHSMAYVPNSILNFSTEL